MYINALKRVQKSLEGYAFGEETRLDIGKIYNSFWYYLTCNENILLTQLKINLKILKETLSKGF